MKVFFSVILFVVIMFFFGFKSEGENTASPKLFIGYINNNPVFDAYKENTLYVLMEKLEVLVKYPINYFPKIVKDKYICYEEKTKTGSNIVLSYENKEERYPLSSRLSYVALDESGTLFYTDIKGEQSIKYITGGQIKNVGVKGYVINIIEGCLYYSKEHDPNLSYANSDIFELDIKSLTLPKKILSNISGESTVIMPNRKYIYEQILSKGKFKPIVYDIDKKKYKEIEIESKFLNVSPFYSYQKDALVFYDIETMEMKVVELSNGFDLEW